MVKEQKHTLGELREYSSYPLYLKIALTKDRIREWYNAHDGQIYVSWSGGKDSTVLLHIVRSMYPDVKAMFLDTGLEYPEIRMFVKSYDNVDWVRPEMSFREVISTYGYPLISKEVAQTVEEARLYDGIKYANSMHKLMGTSTFIGKQTNQYDIPHYAFLLDMPCKISGKCCMEMKKKPAIAYERRTGLKPMIATMATESRLRKSTWLREGCNAFDKERPTSKPMSFWTNQDILEYILQYELRICGVYGDIVKAEKPFSQIRIKMSNGNVEYYIDKKRPLYYTTGCDRTGCMFCGFGITSKCDRECGRFERMKVTHPMQYDYIMRPWEQGGLNYKEILDWINEHGNFSIRY